MSLSVVILAAGKGSRMKSNLPKVLQPLAGRPLLRHVIQTARCLQPQQIVVVYGHGGEQVKAAFPESDLTWVEQAEQLGTGHAVQQAMPALENVRRVVVLYGDVPLTTTSTLNSLLENSQEAFGLLTVELDDPTGYGRIERDINNQVIRIVEQKEANQDQLAIREINTGIMAVPYQPLKSWLTQLSNNNAQGEYYLTDVLAMAVSENVPIRVSQPDNPIEVEGVNNKLQLANLERAYQQQQAKALMLAGVTLADPKRFDLRGSLKHGEDCSIDINVIIEGKVTLGNNVSIGANTVLRNVQIADDVTILENCVLEDAVVGAGSRIGPFARLRPGTKLVGNAHVGNFVEIKKSIVGLGSKVNHLSYVGDSEIGQSANIGAGVITCNYDGANKHKTIIGDNAFVGSNVALVAPIKVGDNATIGAGSTLSRSAPASGLTITRAKQMTLPDWQRPKKKLS